MIDILKLTKMNEVSVFGIVLAIFTMFNILHKKEFQWKKRLLNNRVKLLDVSKKVIKKEQYQNKKLQMLYYNTCNILLSPKTIKDIINHPKFPILVQNLQIGGSKLQEKENGVICFRRTCPNIIKKCYCLLTIIGIIYTMLGFILSAIFIYSLTVSLAGAKEILFPLLSTLPTGIIMLFFGGNEFNKYQQATHFVENMQQKYSDK